METKEVAEGVQLVQSEDQEGNQHWSYVTTWGTLRDVYALIGAIASRQFNVGRVHADLALLKEEGFTALWLAMHEYHGQQPLGQYASYHVFKALRKFIEDWAEMRPGDIYALMCVHGRSFLLSYHSKSVPISRLPVNPDLLEEIGGLTMDLFPAADPQPDRSAFWERLEMVARATNGKTERNLDILKSVVSGVPLREIAVWHGIKRATADSAAYNLRRRLARNWDIEEAWGLLA